MNSAAQLEYYMAELVAALTTAELAARAGRLRIEIVTLSAAEPESFGCSGTYSPNADEFPPPSLNSFRTAASRAPADAAPVLWFWQMTGTEWDRKTASYQDETKLHWRLCSDNMVKEAKRLEKRKRSEEPWFLNKKKLRKDSAPQQLEKGVFRCPW